MSEQLGKPKLPYGVRIGEPASQLLSHGHGYLMGVRALLENELRGQDSPSDQMWGIFNLLCLSEEMIQGAQEGLESESQLVEVASGDARELERRLRGVFEHLDGEQSIDATNAYISDCKEYLAGRVDR